MARVVQQQAARGAATGAVVGTGLVQVLLRQVIHGVEGAVELVLQLSNERPDSRVAFGHLIAPSNWETGTDATAIRNRSATSRTSASVVQRPRLRRIAPMPISGITPIARSTGESSTLPAWQAEPVDAATPSIPARI